MDSHQIDIPDYATYTEHNKIPCELTRLKLVTLLSHDNSCKIHKEESEDQSPVPSKVKFVLNWEKRAFEDEANDLQNTVDVEVKVFIIEHLVEH